VGIERYRPTARVEIDGASRTLLGGNTTSGPKANYSTATVLLDPSEGRPTPGQTVRVWAGYDAALQLLFTGEIDAGGVTLAPNELEVRCTGILSRTKERIGEPPSITDGEADQEYVAIWEGVTASVIIAGILDMYGILAYSLSDSAQTFGNLEPIGLMTSDSGWSLIEQLDEVEGYKTFDGPDGTVIRAPFAGIPSGVGQTLEQGVDLYAGRLDESRTGTYNRVIASGLPQIGSTGIDFVPTEQLDAPSPWIPSPPTYRAFTYASPLFEDADQCGVYCARKLGELNRLRGEMPFDLALGDANLRPGMSIAVDSLILDIRTGVRFWVVEVVHDLGDGFNTSGTLLMASEGTGWSPNQAPIAIIDASAKAETLADSTEIVVVALDGSASYDPELGVLGIVSYSWAGDPVDPTPFDSAMRATAIYMDGIPDGAWIELTVTDDLGKTGKSRIYPAAGGVPVKRRDLISAELTRVQTTRDGGATWVTVSPNVAGVGVTEFAAAEYALAWEADGTLHKILADDTSEEVLTGANITAASISLENGDPERKTGRCWAGASDGKVYRSYDDGVTWQEVSTVPNAAQANYIGESPFQEGDLEVAAGNAAYRSFDAGASWIEEFAHPNTALIARRIASGFGKGWIGYLGTGDDLGESRLQERDDAVELDADDPDKPINVVGLALDPFEDVIYVLDDVGGADGRLFVGDSANGGNLTEAADWEPAWSTPRHLIRDGTAPGYLYISANQYLLKSVDGLASVLELKLLTGGGAGRMIGYGAERTTLTPLTVVSTVGVAKIYELWNGAALDDPPGGWYAQEYDDSTWGLAVEADASGQATAIAGADPLWLTNLPPIVHAEAMLVRQHFTLPPGAVETANLQASFDSNGDIYLNGVYIGGESDTSTSGPILTFTVPPGLLQPGRDNLIAALGRDIARVDPGSHRWVTFKLEVNT
jgi:hypothetical protein